MFPKASKFPQIPYFFSLIFKWPEHYSVWISYSCLTLLKKMYGICIALCCLKEVLARYLCLKIIDVNLKLIIKYVNLSYFAVFPDFKQKKDLHSPIFNCYLKNSEALCLRCWKASTAQNIKNFQNGLLWPTLLAFFWFSNGHWKQID